MTAAAPGTPARAAGALVAVCAFGASAATAVDLLQGTDARWAVAGNLLLVPPAVSLAGWAWRTAPRPAAALATLGILVGPVGALCGDRAGDTWWWLALEAAWWTGVTWAAWPVRPGLAVITALAAGTALLAAAVTALAVAEPVASAAGLRVTMTIGWAAYLGVEEAVRRRGRPR